MIPKIIHYTWFSGEPIPKHLQELMDTWKKVLPDYEFMFWDTQKLSEIDNIFVKEALSVKKWAFAADVVRCYAVYTYGGIYLDSDVEMIHSFDTLLQNRMFIGTECALYDGPKKRYLTSHCFGAEKGHPFLKDCLDYYNNRHFIGSLHPELPEDLQFDMTILPKIQARIATVKYGYNDNGFVDRVQFLKEGMIVYPSYCFDYPRWNSINKVFCIHRHQCSWSVNGNGNNRPDYTSTSPRKFNFEKIIFLGFEGINKFLGKYLHLQLTKTGKLRW